MKLCKVKLVNFRGYKNATFNITNLNVIIGKNDVGKSTIIDALDIYFNDAPIDLNDLNVHIPTQEPKFIEISCCFEVNPRELITLDSSENTATCLEDEYLLNKDGLLEISKIYDCSGGKLSKPSIKIIAKHPNNFETPLIALKITYLKRMARDKGINSTNDSIKKEIRKAIFEQTANLTFDDEFHIETSTKDTDIIELFKKFKDDFPSYMPFRADRTNTDKDKEVNDTTKAITKTVVAGMEAEFQEMKNKINDKIQELASKTLEKLKTFDENIANTLKPDIDSKALDSLFSFTFSCDDGISFNKRGSGVKRLMLLSFFLADVERKNTSNKGVIYAIEEPETSQHPDFQIMLMDALKQLSTANDRQILLTTHTPEIVKMVDKENLIFVQKSDDKSVIVQQDDAIELKKVADTLGILPFVSYKGVIFVEGTTDRKFLKNLNNLPTLKSIVDLNQFTFIPLHGCGNIDIWIKEDYLKNSNVKCLYFKDRDDNTAPAITRDDNVNNVIKTSKREIENYIPYTVVENRFGIQFTDAEKQNWDNIDVASVAVNDHGTHLNPDNRQSENIVKNILQSKDVWDNITFPEADLSEFQNWFEHIKSFFEI